MDVKVISLDDMLSGEELAKLKLRKPRSRVDLSDLLPPAAPRPPEFAIGEVVQVVFMEQSNLCLNCKREHHWPLGLVAMHKVLRHGRMTNDLAGIALTDPNQHPQVPRLHDTKHSTSMVCGSCVDEARFLPSHGLTPIPLPATPQFFTQHSCARSDEVKKVLENWHRRQEAIRRELEEPERHNVPPEIEAVSHMVSEDFEPTNPEDTR